MMKKYKAKQKKLNVMITGIQGIIITLQKTGERLGAQILHDCIGELTDYRDSLKGRSEYEINQLAETGGEMMKYTRREVEAALREADENPSPFESWDTVIMPGTPEWVASMTRFAKACKENDAKREVEELAEKFFVHWNLDANAHERDPDYCFDRAQDFITYRNERRQ